MSKFVQKFSRQVIALTLLFSLVVPNVANAQLLTSDPLLLGRSILEYVGGVLKVAFRNVVVVGAVQVSQKVAKDAAESVATWVWEGAPGKNPLTYMENTGDYIKKQSGKALSDVLDQMSEDAQNANMLCISDPTAVLGVMGGLYASLKDKSNISPFGTQPGMTGEFLATPDLDIGKCDVGSIAVNYKSLTNELSSDQLLKRFSEAAINGGSEVDQVVASQMNALASLVRSQKDAETERLASKSTRDQTAPISGAIVQSSEAIKEDSMLNTAKFQAEQEARMLGGIFSSGAEAIPAIFATTFANALSKKIIDKLKRGKGTNPQPVAVNLFNIFGAGKTVGSLTAGTLYSDVKTVVISEGGLDLLSSFAACPDKYYSTDNCVIDEGFAAAIRTADSGIGKALTVQEAIDQGKLHANGELVPLSKKSLNEDRLCAKTGAYCFSNLAKLRKARVIPIGWEIAAATADGMVKVTLGSVVKGFNNCAYNTCSGSGAACGANNACGTGETCLPGPTRTIDKPYCHLIDPNWVLKMPEQICRAKVFGPQPQSDLGAERQEVCADQASCLQEDSTGQCTGAYGYCLREKNTFRFEADECPAHFAGCRTYGNQAFGSVDIIDSTIDSGSCTDKNTGCMGYIADYRATGAFDDESAKVYLNGQAASCNIQNIGCTEVQNAVTSKQQFLRLPPVGLGCKGLSNDPTACSKYAAACTVDEVGCEVYQPIGSSDAAVPGVITAATRDTSGNVVEWNDECSAQCVGYASYYQVPTPIEPIPTVATAFIPQSAKMCTQDVVGCDAYQNVDTAAKGAGTTVYFSQPQKCSDPEVEKNHSIYYSWEGSDTSGYQLHEHDLVNGEDGPLYDVPAAKKAATLAQCDAKLYMTRVISGNSDPLKNGNPNPLFNTDCRELFDKEGKPFYRLLSKTLPSTANCVAFRKDTADKDNCAASNGAFNATTGSCEYGFLPSASTQCKLEEVGCRAYNGAAALSPKIVMNESFSSVDGWKDGETSNEGITVGDSVLKISGAQTDHAIKVTQGKTYNIVFWAKGQGTINLKFNSKTYTPAEILLHSAPLAVGPEWRRYEVSSPPAAWSDDAASLSFVKVSGAAFYIENVVVKEQTDVVYAVKKSWVTPESCDAIPDDNIPGPALNCHAYKPQSQSNIPQVYLTGFTSLCRAQSAGCQKFVSTQNTKEITSRVVKFDGSQRTIPADDFVYVIANGAASCPADQKGCSALGVKIAGKLETVTKINNPEEYDTTSCKVKDEWCQTFTGTGGTQRYFKYPDLDKQCEYREDIDIGGAKYTGWFKKDEGTPKPCYDNFVIGGSNYGIYKNQDTNFTGMSGMCEPEFNTCTEFVDHAETSKDQPMGRSYYFMKNNRLDTSSCNGKVSLKNGCALLENTDAVSETSFSTLATYCKSDQKMDPLCSAILLNSGVDLVDQAKDGVLVSPVNGTSVSISTNLGINCKKSQINGLFVAVDCEAQLSKLKESTSGTALNAINLLKCDKTTANIEAVQKVVDTTRAVCAPLADANTIVKVYRDRTCAEWLACKSSTSVWDASQKKSRQVCDDLGVCNENSSADGTVGGCGNWLNPGKKTEIPLTTESYVERDIGWYGYEYSGYSLWNKFQVDRYGVFKLPKQTEFSLGVGFDSGCVADDDATVENGAACTSDELKDPINVKTLKMVYGENVQLSGLCYSRKCWYPTSLVDQTEKTYVPSSCRGYPEVDSPFSTKVVKEFSDSFQPLEHTIGFDRVNVCEKYATIKKSESWTPISNLSFYNDKTTNDTIGLISADEQSCDCSYKRVKFGSANASIDQRFYSSDSTKIPAGVCDNGWLINNKSGKKTSPGVKTISKKGMSCTGDFDCIDERLFLNKYFQKDSSGVSVPEFVLGSEDGSCQFVKSITNVLGWKGYCLEYDMRTYLNGAQNERICSTWLPIDATGGFDLYNQYFSAGYQPKSSDAGISGALYCTNSSGALQKDGSNIFTDKIDQSVKDLTVIPEGGYGMDPSSGTSCSSKKEAASLNFDGPNKIDSWNFSNPMVSCVNKLNENSSVKKPTLPSDVQNLTPADIDYIDVTFGDNKLIPKGYTVRIADDGIIRFYTTKSFHAANNGSICPASYANNKAQVEHDTDHDYTSASETWGYGVYNMLDPKFLFAANTFSSIGGAGYNNGNLMEKLSYEARCPRPADGTQAAQTELVLPKGCDKSDDSSLFFSKDSTKQNVADYFKCIQGGEKVYDPKEDTDTKKRTTVTTGVVRTSYKYLNPSTMTSLRTVGDAVDIVNGNFSEMWYLRLDNRLHSALEVEDNDPHGDTDHFDRSSGFGDSTTLFGLVNNFSGVVDNSGFGGNLFDGACSAKGSGDSEYHDGDDSHVAYELRFNFRDGSLSSVYAVLCDSGGNGDAGNDQVKGFVQMPITISYALRNKCTNIAAVTSDPKSTITENRAFTDKVWVGPSEAGDYKFVDEDSLLFKAGSQQNIKRNRAGVPFGSFSGNSTPDLFGPQNNFTSSYWFTDALNLTYKFDPASYAHKSGVPPVFKQTLVSDSVAYGCPNGKFCVKEIEGDADGGGNGTQNILDKLFAKIYFVYGSSGGNGSNLAYPVKDTKSETLFDKSTLDVHKNNYPHILAFNPSECKNPGTCRITKDMGFVVNGEFRVGASIVGKKMLATTLQFYGWADRNHMPLRRIMVDWNDNSNISGNVNGRYRNHKPVCSKPNKPAPFCVIGGNNPQFNMTCSTDADCVNSNGAVVGTCTIDNDKLQWSFGNWGGNSPDAGACEESFFQFSHAYTFSETCKYSYDNATSLGINSDGPTTATSAVIKALKLEGKVGLQERFCVFRPKVQLRDNWDVCNGVTSSSDLTPKGYGGVAPDSSLMCDFDKIKTYTPYQGYIIVKE